MSLYIAVISRGLPQISALTENVLAAMTHVTPHIIYVLVRRGIGDVITEVWQSIENRMSCWFTGASALQTEEAGAATELVLHGR
uniref:Uncharacterized protein n=1 Tax=Parascaris equorum TaxID=6256 RepID=A0A914SE40_PAREQ